MECSFCDVPDSPEYFAGAAFAGVPDQGHILLVDQQAKTVGKNRMVLRNLEGLQLRTEGECQFIDRYKAVRNGD